ncbi:MAG: IS66 family insertion sequence element accessory protein TnpB [Proteobacteria bacterium]|nr:IS66 family insertion sequence element accessory protein TnpB [Desulfobacula sp.]MBU3949867.1 IS66 family insertion sequence element accessory protein TnpB [Pseudomonadota bacterium]MBU4133474.1 IS66 family insertion sequence element accessory protein TnpB [Pseudomonadota bacterium]
MEKTWKEKNQERHTFWKTHLEQWSASGLSQREYCRQNDLIAHRFTYWKIKLKGTHLPVKFVQIPPEPIRICPSNLKLNIGPGLQIEIPEGFSQVTLELVLATLRVL